MSGTFVSCSFLVAVLGVLLHVSALQLDHTYPLVQQGNYSRVRLRCKRDTVFLSNAQYYLNGSLITADRVVGYEQSSMAVSYTITQDVEGAVSCRSEEEFSEEVLLAGQPQDYRFQNRSRYALLSRSTPSSVTLQCDVTPGRLRSLYSLRWFRLFVTESGKPGFQPLLNELVDLDTFNLRLNSTNLLQRGERVIEYQCRVTVQHDPSSTNRRDYHGPKIFLHTRVQAEITHAAIQTSIFIGDPVTLNCTATGDSISFRWTIDDKTVQQGQCVDDLCVSVTPQTTPTTSQFTIRNLMEVERHHVTCQVTQHLPPEFNINAITITSGGVLTVAERPEQNGEDDPSSPKIEPAPPRVPEPPSSNDLGTTQLLDKEHITLLIGVIPATFVIVVLSILAFLLMWGRKKMKKRCGKEEEEDKAPLDKQPSNSSDCSGGKGVEETDGLNPAEDKKSQSGWGQQRSQGQNSGAAISANSTALSATNPNYPVEDRKQTQSRRGQRRSQRQDSRPLLSANSTTSAETDRCYKKSVSCPAEPAAKPSRRLERRLQRQTSLDENTVHSLQSTWFPSNAKTFAKPPSQRLKHVPLVVSPLKDILEHEMTPVEVQESNTGSVAMTISQGSVAVTTTATAEQMNAEDAL